MRNIIINGVLIPSIYKLYETDYHNICFGVSERNICARLAFHMENIMRCHSDWSIFQGYYADVEYNRMNNGDLKQYVDSKQLPRYMVSDLLIHSRDERRNYLAAELKRKGNNKNVLKDKERLEALVKPTHDNPDFNCVCDTMVGAFITYSKKDVKIEIFENVNGSGVQTEVIEFLCRDDRVGHVLLIRI